MRYLLILSMLFLLNSERGIAQIKNTLEDFDYTKKTIEEKELDYDEYILKNGFFLDGLVQHVAALVDGVGINRINLEGGGIGFRLGSKWYFGKMKTYRPGFSAVWGRANILLLQEQSSTSWSPQFAIAPANIGFTNAFSFGGKIGLEVNINFGLNAIVDIFNASSIIGYLINPTIKFRYKKLAIGLDVTIMKGEYIGAGGVDYSNQMIGLTVGGKF